MAGTFRNGFAAIVFALAALLPAAPAWTAGDDNPAAREEREYQWRKERQERREDRIEQKKKEDAARERLEQRQQQRQKDYEERKRAIDSSVGP